MCSSSGDTAIGLRSLGSEMACHVNVREFILSCDSKVYQHSADV